MSDAPTPGGGGSDSAPDTLFADRPRTAEIVPHRTVTFEDTGEKREVAGDCRVCFRAAESYGCGVVSPSGIAHIGCDGGVTLCGHDATVDGWWWPL